MAVTRMCLCFLLRAGPEGQPQVLLGRKKRGLGAGNIVGLGGKLEAGEDARAAAVREIAEEAGVTVAADDLTQRALITYRFPTRPAWDQDATVFTCTWWFDEPVESDEITPAWYDIAAIPIDGMWADARHWLPQVMTGEPIGAHFSFGEDLQTLTYADVHHLGAANSVDGGVLGEGVPAAFGDYAPPDQQD